MDEVANCIESVVGALVIDQGPEVARKFVADSLLPSLLKLSTSDEYAEMRGGEP